MKLSHPPARYPSFVRHLGKDPINFGDAYARCGTQRKRERRDAQGWGGGGQRKLRNLVSVQTWKTLFHIR